MQVCSIQEEALVHISSLSPLIDKAAETAAAISSGTKQALKARREAGVNLGSPGDNKKAAKASAEVRSKRKIEIIERIADLLNYYPEYLSLTHRELADILNRQGILSGHNRTWTGDSVRQRMKKVREEMQRRAEMEAALNEEQSRRMRELPNFGMF